MYQQSNKQGHPHDINSTLQAEHHCSDLDERRSRELMHGRSTTVPPSETTIERLEFH